MKIRRFTPITIVAVLAVAAYWYWSPYVAIYSMREAAAKKDADTFNEYVDYGRLRESLKGQISAIFAERMSENARNGESVASTGIALGTMLGMALVGNLIDAMVRPESVMHAMQQGMLDTPGPTKPAAGEGGATRHVEWTFDRKSADKIIARALQDGDPPDRSVGFVFERSGFSSWKLTEIRFPTPNK